MEWINLNKNKPKVDDEYGFCHVLVYCKLWGIYMATYTRILDSNFYEWKDWNGKTQIPPTHWMPLPEKPKSN